MVRWGGHGNIDLPTLKSASQVLLKQQQATGGNFHADPFTPPAIIANEAVSHGTRVAERLGLTADFASVGMTDFVLGYLYCLAERGELDAVLADMNIQGGAPDDNTISP